MGLSFITASADEIAEIYEYAGVNRREATNHMADDNRERMIEAYEHSAKYGAYFRCLMDGDTMIGWVYVDKAYDYLTGDEIGWISDIFVKHAFRGSGYSTLLIDEALKEFRENGYEEAGLNVYAHNEVAMKLYDKMGFRDVNKFMKRPL